jgi:hypothetical protein
MVETQAKYHHLIPQTYMSAWAHGNGTLNAEFLNAPGNIIKRNKEKIAGITDFHSIKAGMPLCTKTDTDIIFAPVLPYTIQYEGRTLQSSVDMNKYYYDFDNWIMKRKNGSLISKKVKREIEKIKIRDIEANWSTKYENSWTSKVSRIEADVLLAPNGSISAFDKEYLMKFFTALNWRGFRSNQHFEETYRTLTCGLLDDLEIPEDKRILPSLKTAADEIRHSLLLQYYRQYLNDTGVIFKDAMANLQHTNFHFKTLFLH